MVVTATQIKIKDILGFFRFIAIVRNIKVQLRNTDGLVFQQFKGLRTLTGWENNAEPQAFRNSGHHLNAMKNIKNIGKAKSVTWETQSEPGWTEAIEKLRDVHFNA